MTKIYVKLQIKIREFLTGSSRGDVPGWVLVVLMTTALVTLTRLLRTG